jgi:hypothetical protein
VSAIDLRDYVAGGYFITKFSSEGFWKSPLMPERVISLSTCLCKRLEIYWGWNINQYQHVRNDFGISDDKLDAFREWSQRAKVDPPSGFHDIDEGRYIAKEFLTSIEDVLLVGAGIHRELVDEFLAFKSPLNNQSTGGSVQNDTAYEHAKAHLSDHFVNQRIPLAAGGINLGFEVISNYFDFGHSWLCSGLEKEMHELFGIKPNRYGLIDTYAEARRVYDWIAEDNMQGTRTEPEPYYPWLIVHYPLT